MMSTSLHEESGSAAIDRSELAGSQNARNEVWASIARGYAAFGSPFVPCVEEIHAYEAAVAAHAEAIESRAIDALMLGVTPGIASMRWPKAAKITAVERSSAVIGALWPGDIPGVRKAHCASWFDLPMARNSCDVVLGDGSLNACRIPGEVQTLCSGVNERLRDGGLLIVRCYIQREEPESIDAVFDALFSETGLSVDHFKLRLYMAMQHSVQQGVAVREASRVPNSYHLDQRTMEERLGWSKAAIEPFQKWRTSDSVYTFTSLPELRVVVGEWFDEVAVTWPDYEIGHCCPTLVLRSRAGTTSRSR